MAPRSTQQQAAGHHCAGIGNGFQRERGLECCFTAVRGRASSRAARATPACGCGRPQIRPSFVDPPYTRSHSFLSSTHGDTTTPGAFRQRQRPAPRGQGNSSAGLFHVQTSFAPSQVTAIVGAPAAVKIRLHYARRPSFPSTAGPPGPPHLLLSQTPSTQHGQSRSPRGGLESDLHTQHADLPLDKST